MASIKSIRHVAERHLCTGCGTCAYMQPNVIEMVDDLDQGRRPLVKGSADTREALGACPGVALEHDYDRTQPGLVRAVEEHWGPVLDVWEGFAADPEIRWSGSSGGAASALTLYAIEQQGFHGVLHIAARPDVPWLNHTVLSHTRQELLAATGSRYAPASPCDGLDKIAKAPGPCVLIGKPCDIAGANMAARRRSELSERLGLTIAIFCAGTPSTSGTLEMLKRMGFDNPSQISSIRYRGEGWPGNATATGHDSAGQPKREQLTYEQSWGGILNKHRPWRCYVCADHTGEFADIAVGDPWYREIPDNEPGRSLVVARTHRGREFVEQAIAARALELKRVDPSAIEAAQPNLLMTRGAVWGRTWATRLVGVAAPRYTRLGMFKAWRLLTRGQRIKSFLGTWERVITKRLYRRRRVRPLGAEESQQSTCSHKPAQGALDVRNDKRCRQ